jgi:hypothetical protein
VAAQEIAVGKIRIESVKTDQTRLLINANINCSYIPFRRENVAYIYKRIKALLPKEFAKYSVELRTDKHLIEELIPFALREKLTRKDKAFTNPSKQPVLVRNLSAPHRPTEGLQGHHIALWQSHGFYYESKLTRWEWQRARIFQTVEDLYTQSYVLPFLVPMLENAGANVLMPRERDTQSAELVVDNDGCFNHASAYAEFSGVKPWETGKGAGFAQLRAQYVDSENPFKEGTFRLAKTITTGEESRIEWQPEIPQAGYYAVYVSYQTVKNSTNEAVYTVHHLGGSTQFALNQQMGGGTWIYLGHFRFGKGKSDAGKVALTNRTGKAGQIITADAVKIGGGYGNIARTLSENGISPNIKSSDSIPATVNSPQENLAVAPTYPYEVSGYPRFTEGARYWLQWAGFPDSIYSPSKGTNDYTDDYRSRGYWVNYLAGGTTANPKQAGLNIPVDIAFAFHSDAGTTPNDSIIGTLGIFQAQANGGIYENNASRYRARDLTDLVQSNIVSDVRRLYEPNWSRRGMWNQSYSEATTPKVPTMLLELLSHQNFADMRYGLDPRFRFTVSRAIYKGMLQFIASQYGTDYVIQPLPVDHLRLRSLDEQEIELQWEAVEDPLEPSAKAESYLVYTRIGAGGFDNGTLVTENIYRTQIPEGVVCSFKVTAINKGGESFPSEILSAGRAAQRKGTVLVINGFDRVSAPADFDVTADSLAGFLDEQDHGVPYLADISYIGRMKEFRRVVPWMDDDASGFGDSFANYETMVIAGNSLDYPAMHGEAILKAGYSFLSASNEAVESGQIQLSDYRHVDLILGKQCQTKMGRGGVTPLQFKTFSDPMQQALTDYCGGGGNLLVSGAYVGTDLWDNQLAPSLEKDRKFAVEVLKYKWRAGRAAITGRVKSVISPAAFSPQSYRYFNELNSESYVVESPDAIEPAAAGAHTILRYSENNLSAGVAYKGAYRTCILGFPLESLRTSGEREQLISDILRFFE